MPRNVPNNSTHQPTRNRDQERELSARVAGLPQQLRGLRVDEGGRERYVSNSVGLSDGVHREARIQRRGEQTEEQHPSILDATVSIGQGPH